MGQIQQDREVDRMKERIGEKGLVKGIFIILVLVAVAFLLISYGMPYYRYFVLGSHTRDILQLGNRRHRYDKNKNHGGSTGTECAPRRGKP